MSEPFAHRLPLDRIGEGHHVEIVAAPAERTAIAQRLGLERLDRLEATATLSRTGELVRARGRLLASLEQACVVTGEPVAALVDEPFDLMFVADPTGRAPDEEIELSSEDCDVVFHDGQAIDLAAAIVDTLALAVDPYPRSAGADAALKEAGVLSEGEAGPFAALAKLKGKEGE